MSEKNKQNISVTASKNTAIRKWPDIHPISKMERLFNHYYGYHWPSLRRNHRSPLEESLIDLAVQRLPCLDVVDRNNEFLVRVDVPGVEKTNINISLTDNLLTIKGHPNGEEQEEGDYYRHEIFRTSFARTVLLPGSVSASKTIASLKNGVLEITLPKVDEVCSSKRRNISIQ